MLFMLCLFCSRFSACLHFQPQSVGNQCDKFRIGRLALMVIDCVAEQCINRIHLPAVPCNLNRMANGAFHTARCGVAFFCDGGIQLLRDIIQHIHIVNTHDDCLAHVMIAANMCRHADFMQNIRHLRFQVIHGSVCSNGGNGFQKRLLLLHQLANPLCQRVHVKGLHHVVACTQVQCLLHHLVLTQRGKNDCNRTIVFLHFLQSFQNAKPIQTGHNAINHGNIRVRISDFIHGINTVHGNCHHSNVLLFIQMIDDDVAKILIVIRQKHFYCILIQNNPSRCSFLNVYAELPCFWVDYSIENFPRQEPFVGQKKPEMTRKTKIFRYFSNSRKKPAVCRRRMYAELVIIDRKRGIMRTKICEKEVNL